MSRQIQFRRGTAAEHENFTGAVGEITVDTTNNTLRVHDGATIGGTALARADAVTDMSGADYVIAWQQATADNNHTWYRRYRSGWVEMGGKLAATITFPITMCDTRYTITVSNASGTYENFRYKDRTVTGFAYANTANSSAPSGYWMVCGFAE